MKHARQVFCTGLLGAMALASTGANAASLIGDSVDVVLSGGIVLEDFGVVVGPGVELQGGDASTNWGAFLFPTESVDIGADTISMAFDTSLGDGAILTFSDLDFGAGIGGVTLISSIPEVTQANVSFTATSITLDLDAWFDVGGAGTLDLQLTEVPLPAAAWLFVAALGSLGLTRRRS